MILKTIKTNVITGFLGAGKTSLILSLLKLKPENETWAILVNEFGEIGIDASLMAGTHSSEQVVIKEVAGGCLCCAAGIPTQVAINQLIQKAKPDRLFIEPTGLGHPAEILKVLTNEYNRQVLSVNQTVCVVDARKVLIEAYRDNENFNQQLRIADIVYASKADLYQAQEFESLSALIGRVNQESILISANAESAIKLLLNEIDKPLLPRAKSTTPIKQSTSLGKSTSLTQSSASIFKPVSSSEPLPKPVEFNQGGYWVKSNQGEGAFSIGWIFDPSLCFEFDKLISFINQLIAHNVVRIKAVMITEEGIAGFNMSDGKLSVMELDDAMDSRIEIISLPALNETTLTEQLLACLTAN
ncbi:CobW family GTP-binding protein [Shewanella japonica]|uniref:Cobalamin biosynthesis protein CobW n=1 Tax=Shewanella japonica TaxID=93973 RepID=A0ABN4YLP8_9GAMM|nr:GTP-binding protein [Shewanella japonica]ARD23175.1 cobalamin biosynthesis protein CobW [Shewanella japonica]